MSPIRTLLASIVGYAVLSSSAALPTQNFTITHNDTSFQLYVNDLLIISHDDDNPAVLVGTGETTFHELHGNFIIDDKITERHQLDAFFIGERAADQQSILLGGARDGDTVELTVALTTAGVVNITGGLRQRNPLAFNRLWVRLHAEPEEAVFGGGEQYTYLNMRTRYYPIWTREQGVIRDPSNPLSYVIDLEGGAGGDYHTTYWPQASFLSSRGYYFISGTHELSGLNFTSERIHEYYTQNSGVVDLTLAVGTPLEIVQWTNTGRQLVPDWAMSGVILGVQGGTEVMLDMYRRARDSGIQVAGMWIQDWAGRKNTTFGERLFWNWRWNETMYPGLDDAIKQLDDEGVKVLAYINPHLNIEGDIYQNNTGKGYFLQNANGEDYIIDFGGFSCVTVDLLSEAASEWYQELIRTNLLDLGMAGWMADFGEYIPVDAVSANGSALTSPAALHNLYPSLWGRANRRAVAAAGKERDTLFFVRAGSAEQAQHAAGCWSGDQDTDWTVTDGAATTVTSALSLAVSGCGVSHFDIGGYTTFQPFFQRSQQLLLRSAEAAIFTPLMRTHEGSRPQYNVQWYSSNETLAAFARLSHLFVALAPYRRAILAEYYRDRTPLQRPVFLHYPETLAPYEAAHSDHVYLLGGDLLVAPVWTANVSVWQVALPGGGQRWRHLWTGQLHPGASVAQVDAPLGQPPVFYRDNSQWRELFQTIGNMTVTAWKATSPVN